MPLQATSGAASQDAFGGNGVAVVPNYIEDMFSTYLYTGTGASQTITNGIDLAGKGGLVWLKIRNGTGSHRLVDTVRGGGNVLVSNAANANVYDAIVPTFSSSGFDTGGGIDISSFNFVSWTFRKQPKFFDVVTYTGTGSNATISHNLGSVPGCIIVKRTDAAGTNWAVYHRGTSAGNKYLLLNSTAAEDSGFFWNPTSTTFDVSSTLSLTANGGTYICYLFAHNAGGFGLTGTDNVISCGSYTGNGSTSGPTVTLGYEPQWLLVKNATTTGNWFLMDNMRGIPMSGDTAILKANTSAAEDNNQGHAIELNATGFQVTTSFTGTNGSGDTLIYIAIRRSPMKVPTTGTSVFSPVARTGTGAAANITTAGFTPDLLIGRSRLATTSTPVFVDRLRGNTKFLQSAVTDAEGTSSAGADVTGFLMNGFSLGVSGGTDLNTSSASEIYYPLKRAPSFMDVVCYTGTGSARTVSHNLQAVPELMIAKCRGDTGQWAVYSSNLTASNFLFLNSTAASATNTAVWNATAPTSSVFSVGTSLNTNSSGFTFVAYLFATCAGVSKCTSFTGNGTSQTINCGFTSGARFVMIKATSTTGNWTVFDSARGISAGGDPALYLNSTAAEVTGIDAIDADSTGFIVNQEGTFNLNSSGVQYLVLAIA